MISASTFLGRQISRIIFDNLQKTFSVLVCPFFVGNGVMKSIVMVFHLHSGGVWVAETQMVYGFLSWSFGKLNSF